MYLNLWSSTKFLF